MTSNLPFLGSRTHAIASAWPGHRICRTSCSKRSSMDPKMALDPSRATFLPIFDIVILSFFWESLTENDGRGSVYLDGWVMGSNYLIKYRFCGESPRNPKKTTLPTKNPHGLLNQVGLAHVCLHMRVHAHTCAHACQHVY